jgi:hypothetical protein
MPGLKKYICDTYFLHKPESKAGQNILKEYIQCGLRSQCRRYVQWERKVKNYFESINEIYGRIFKLFIRTNYFQEPHQHIFKSPGYHGFQ